AAVPEERITRKKHAEAFPAGAIAFCLKEAGVAIEEIDELAHGFDYAPYRGLYALDPVSRELYREVYSRDALLELVWRDLPGFPEGRVQAVNHDRAHAASAAFTSGGDECLVVVIDGMGEAHSASVYHASGARLERLFQISALDSIGILYSLITLHLGFDFNADEYKIMGLAPYGDAARFRRFFEEAVALTCTANGRLLQAGLFDEIYVQPAAGDDGSALGAALWRAAQAGEVRNERLPVPFLGPAYGRAEIAAALAACGERVEAVELESLAATVAEAARLIAQGRVVAWYRGRME